MIRQRTPIQAQFAWYRAQFAPDPPLRHDGEPECGWFRMQRVKGGPYLPVEISMVQICDPETGELTEPERLVATSLGAPVDPVALWTRLTPITRAEFAQLNDLHRGLDVMRDHGARIDLTRNIHLPH